VFSWSYHAGADATVGNHVGDPGVLASLDQLGGAKAEVVAGSLAVPLAVGAFGFRPPAGDRQNEALAPPAEVVAHVAMIFGPLAWGLVASPLMILSGTTR
jgi:hypothetical protein